MPVTSVIFFSFLFLVALAIACAPHRQAWVVLLIASYIAYAIWDWLGLPCLLIQTLVTYWAALYIERGATQAGRRVGLSVGVLASVGMLLVLKYPQFISFAFTSMSKWGVFNLGISAVRLRQPLGVSFFTFAHVGYLIDVYHRRMPAERHLGRVALFGGFFPHVLCGPIPRASQLLPQLSDPVTLTPDRLQSGALLVLWGLFKKLVVADRLAEYVNPVFGNVHAQNSSTLALASYSFAFQIYCDFSGYTDIALGSAKIVGIDLMENFRRPYFSRSVGEFWRRWHISLSTWFRDYLYIPLGGSRVAAGRWIVNVLIVFLLSGLWHGSNWTFVLWGAIHGIYLIAERFSADWRDRIWIALRIGWLRPAVSMFLTFNLVVVAWIFFRAANVGDAVFVVRSLPHVLSSLPWQGNSQVTTVISVAVVGILVIVEAAQSLAGRNSSVLLAVWRPLAVQWTAYTALILIILVLSVSSNGFIYGKF